MVLLHKIAVAMCLLADTALAATKESWRSVLRTKSIRVAWHHDPTANLAKGNMVLHGNKWYTILAVGSANGLLTGWEKHHNNASNCFFYRYSPTGAVQWERPP